MSYRAMKSGFAAEAHAKGLKVVLIAQVQGKYNEKAAHDVLEWVSAKIGENFDTSGNMDNFHCQLKDGVKLCKLVKRLNPHSKIKEDKYKKTPTMAFKQMELVGMAIEEIKCFGVSDTDSFQTVDLVEAGNLNQVVICIESLGRKVGELGPKEASENKRIFTDEQMKAGQNVIGLQMGTNKGASQSGMNIGKTRHIMD